MTAVLSGFAFGNAGWTPPSLLGAGKECSPTVSPAAVDQQQMMLHLSDALNKSNLHQQRCVHVHGQCRECPNFPWAIFVDHRHLRLILLVEAEPEQKPILVMEQRGQEGGEFGQKDRGRLERVLGVADFASNACSGLPFSPLLWLGTGVDLSRVLIAVHSDLRSMDPNVPMASEHPIKIVEVGMDVLLGFVGSNLGSGLGVKGGVLAGVAIGALCAGPLGATTGALIGSIVGAAIGAVIGSVAFGEVGKYLIIRRKRRRKEKNDEEKEGEEMGQEVKEEGEEREDEEEEKKEMKEEKEDEEEEELEEKKKEEEKKKRKVMERWRIKLKWLLKRIKHWWGREKHR